MDDRFSWTYEDLEGFALARGDCGMAVGREIMRWGSTAATLGPADFPAGLLVYIEDEIAAALPSDHGLLSELSSLVFGDPQRFEDRVRVGSQARGAAADLRGRA